MNQYDKIKKEVNEFNERLEKAYDNFYGDNPNKPQVHPVPEHNQFNTIKTHVQDFRNKLDDAYQRFNTTPQQDEDKQTSSHKSSRKPFSLQKRKKKFSQSLFDTPEPWRPTYTHLRYFDKYKPITPLPPNAPISCLNPWEILRTKHLVKRSYSKQKEFLFNKDIIPPYGVGTYFDEYYKRTRNEHFVKLSKTGNTLIERFRTENKEREQMLKDKEQQLYDYKHSKPPLQINPWIPFIKRKVKTIAHEDAMKYIHEYPKTERAVTVGNDITKALEGDDDCKGSNANMKLTRKIRIEKDCEGEFSIPRADEVHSFVVTKPKKFLIQDPYRIPKKEGDYFYDRETQKECQLHF